MKKTYGEQIRKRREELGYSQTVLALKTGISKECISRWENGKAIPKKDARDLLEKALRMEFEQSCEPQKLYLAVTPDKYSLPLAVADSAEELAELRSVTKGSIFSRISEGKKRQYPSYIMVEIEKGDDV